MVEAVANGVEDKLVDGLSFRLSPGASYVTNRRSVTFHPQGSNIYSPTSGTRLIKISAKLSTPGTFLRTMPP